MVLYTNCNVWDCISIYAFHFIYLIYFLSRVIANTTPLKYDSYTTLIRLQLNSTRLPHDSSSFLYDSPTTPQRLLYDSYTTLIRLHIRLLNDSLFQCIKSGRLQNDSPRLQYDSGMTPGIFDKTSSWTEAMVSLIGNVRVQEKNSRKEK